MLASLNRFGNEIYRRDDVKYSVIIGLLIGITIVFGQLVSGVDASKGVSKTSDIKRFAGNEDLSCLNCNRFDEGQYQPRDNSTQPKARVTSLQPFNQELDEGVYFTESGIPVRLVEIQSKSNSHIQVTYNDVFNALGQKVALDNKLVVSVFDKRKGAPELPVLNIRRPEASKPNGASPVLASGRDRSTLNDNHRIQATQLLTQSKDTQSEAMAHTDVAKTTSQSVQGSAITLTVSDTGTPISDHPEVAMKSKSSIYKKLALYGVPIATVATLSKSDRNNSVFRTASVTEGSASKLLMKTSVVPNDGRVKQAGIVINTQANSTTDSDSTDATDLLLADQIDDVEDDLDDLTDTVTDLSSTVSDVQSDVTTLESEVSTLQTQLGSNDVDALAAQIETLESKTFAGIAAAASLVTAIPSEPGKTIVNVGSGYYEGETAIGVSLSRRMRKVNGYLYSGVATGISELDSPLIRVGVGIEF